LNGAAEGNGTATPPAGLLGYTHAIYALHALAVVSGLLGAGSIAGRFVFGLPSLIAVIMNYARRAEARGTWLESHFRWQIRTFWFALLWIGLAFLVAAPLTLVLVGILVAAAGLLAVGAWVAYRVLRGWLALRDRRALPLPAPAPAVPA
jgi:uncharacterized membrane protein